MIYKLLLFVAVTSFANDTFADRDITIRPGPSYCTTRCSALTNSCTTSCL